MGVHDSVEGRGSISRSGQNQNIKIGIDGFLCDVPQQWISKQMIGPVSLMCDGLECHVLYLRHGISVWQNIGQSTTATNGQRRDMTSDVYGNVKS